MTCCNIEVVRGVVSVFQNWFTKIPNPSLSSRQDEFSILYWDEWRCRLSIEYYFLSFLGDVEFEAAHSRTNFVGSRWLVVTLKWFAVWSQCSKIGLQRFRIRRLVRGRMSFLFFIEMSEYVAYPSSITSCHFWGMSSSKLPILEPILWDRGDLL